MLTHAAGDGAAAGRSSLSGGFADVEGRGAAAAFRRDLQFVVQAKSEAHELRLDVELMEGFKRSHVSAQSHAAALTRIAGHINQTGCLLEKLQAGRESGRPFSNRPSTR